LLIALRDNASLLADPEGILSGLAAGKMDSGGPDSTPPPTTLYPQGFGAEELVAVIESERVWRHLESTKV
jgi:hypothetical protein